MIDNHQIKNKEMVNRKLNKYDMKNLLLEPLKVSFVRKNFIQNFKANYEQYLTEFINCSKFVMDNGGNKFWKIKEQAHSECDVTNGNYSIDYKLLMDNKTIEEMYYHSENIAIDKNGAVIYSASKENGKWRRYVLISIFRGLSKKDIEKIESTKTNELNELEILVKKYLKNIKKDKNILYFVPFNFFFKKTIMDIEALKYVGNNLSNDLKGFFEYRNANTNKKDTYLSFVSRNNIVFFKYEKKLELYDFINLDKSQLYCRLEDINDTWALNLW